MSNLMPQAPSNNQQTGTNLENYPRVLADTGNELCIVCGSYGRGGTGSNGYATAVAGGRVTVPARCWKELVVLPVGTNDVARVSSTRPGAGPTNQGPKTRRDRVQAVMSDSSSAGPFADYLTRCYGLRFEKPAHIVLKKKNFCIHKERWLVERTLAWLSANHRLSIGYRHVLHADWVARPKGAAETATTEIRQMLNETNW